MIVALGILLGAASARAQAPGANPYHAEPARPSVFPSPMPSLPPPVSAAPGESPSNATPNVGTGTTIVRPGFRMRTNADGSVQFGDKRFSAGSPFVAPFLTFGGTDMMMDALGEDPYRAEKLQLMDATRPQRIKMRRNFDDDQMERALADLPRYLAAVWQEEGWPVEIRRSILFALWDEAAEHGSPLLRDGGRRAREIIAGFIYQTVPRGSAQAYTSAELTELNRLRTSTEEFAPYQSPPI